VPPVDVTLFVVPETEVTVPDNGVCHVALPPVVIVNTFPAAHPLSFKVTEPK